MAEPDLTQTQFSPIEDIVGPMTSCQLFAIFEELEDHGDELRAIPRHERIERIVAVVRALPTRYGEIFQRLITECAAEIGWHPRMVRYVLDDFLSMISETSLHVLLEEELGAASHENTFSSHPQRTPQQMLVPPEIVLHILASTIPTAAIEAIIFSLAAGIPCVIRSSAHERASARFFLHVMRQEDPELAQHVSVVTWSHDDPKFVNRIAQARPTVVFHGSEASIQHFCRELPEDIVVHRFGHRMSFGWIAMDKAPPQEAIAHIAERIAWDAGLFEGQGCMSMQTLFVQTPGADPAIARQIAAQLAGDGFCQFAATFPRGATPPTIAAQQMQECGLADFSGNAFRGPHGHALLWQEPKLRTSPGFRHLHICTIDTPNDLLTALAPYRNKLSTAGILVPKKCRRRYAKLLASAGVRRICNLGRMQRPVILSAHDGQQKIRPWFQICELEG